MAANACSQLSKVAEALALRRACPADLSGLHVDEEMHAADAAESRERVQAAAARLRSEKAERPDETQRNVEAPSSGDVVEGEIVETRGVEETTDAMSAQEIETPPPADPRAELDQARREVQELAGRLGMGFDTVNERCVDDFGVSYQDASPEQLRVLLNTLQPDDGETGEDASAKSDPTAGTSPTRRRASAKKAAPRKAAAKTTTRKSTAEKPTARKSSRSKATARSAQ
ncbi:hypothetical protein GCM10009601_41630 [Streptomyces thermospinosisporus]|uniref:Uncharacterized protein n=1 Tax=Streptomyces thermospinosisporus TaxID=161482 RepID=A0ABP4JT99_9ACTN